MFLARVYPQQLAQTYSNGLLRGTEPKTTLAQKRGLENRRWHEGATENVPNKVQSEEKEHSLETLPRLAALSHTPGLGGFLTGPWAGGGRRVPLEGRESQSASRQLGHRGGRRVLYRVPPPLCLRSLQ